MNKRMQSLQNDSLDYKCATAHLSESLGCTLRTSLAKKF